MKRFVSLFSIFFLILIVKKIECCRDVIVQTPRFEDGTPMHFQLVPLDEAYSTTGRPIYVHKNSNDGKQIYLYHSSIGPSNTGVARWILNDVVNDKDNALAWIDSWAVAPHMITSVQDGVNSYWHTYMKYQDDDGGERGEWETDRDFSVYCQGEDTSIYFDSPFEIGLSGFYVERALPRNMPQGINYDAPLYTRIISREITEGQNGHLFLFKGHDKWIIGDTWGVEHGIAYVQDSANHVFDYRHDEWSFAVPENEGGGWKNQFARAYSSRTEVSWSEENVYAYSDTTLFIRALRSIKHIPLGQRFVTMRNGVPLPLLGLGTGGLRLEDGEGGAYSTIANAMHLGYRTFDLAREYQNEHLIAQIMKNPPEPPSLTQIDEPHPTMKGIPPRFDMFFISKVWPTHLGFWPTTESIEASLDSMDFNYIDSYLLHWPSCNKKVEWMHCEDTIDPSGTWMQSWKALERAYSEGKLNSIGVSNFDVNLLDQLLEMAVVKPHIVQNYAAIGTEKDASGTALDLEVRAWCRRHGVVYMPYAQTRNLSYKGKVNKLSSRKPPRPGRDLLHYNLDAAAFKHKRTRLACVLRFFLQTGAAIIPRASKLSHLVDNLKVFDFEMSQIELESLGWEEFPEQEQEMEL